MDSLSQNFLRSRNVPVSTPVGRSFNPANPIVGPRGTSKVPTPKGIVSLGKALRGGLPALAAEGALMLGDRLIPGGVPSEIRGSVQGGAIGSIFGPPGTALGVLLGADLANERGKGTGTITGEFERGALKLDPLEARRLYMDQVQGPIRSMDMDAPTPRLTDTNQFLSSPEGTQQPARDELPALTPLEERAYQSESSRLQQQAAADPWFQQNELYRKAQEQANKSGLPDDRSKVEELGLAIHAAKFGDPTSRSTPNPLMEGLQRQPVSTPRDETARMDAMNMAAQAVNQMLAPTASAPSLADTIYNPATGINETQTPGFNTSATVDLSGMGASITDMQPNLNPFAANRSGEKGFAFDKNILDKKKQAAFINQLGRS